jgi:hypothetical protein
MKSALSLLLLAAAGTAAAFASCTVVAPGGGQDAGTKIIIITLRPDALPQPKQVTASVLYVANLQRSSVNLADAYSRVILGVTAYLDQKGVKLENMGLISTYADALGPRLLLGRRAGVDPSSSMSLLAALAAAKAAGITDLSDPRLLPYLSGSLSNIKDGDLPLALRTLAQSGAFDGAGQTSEAKALIDFGRNINTLALPPEQGGIERSALFDKPRDLFLVVYLQPLPRRCAIGSSACLVDGRDPTQIFQETRADGSAAWLAFSGKGIRAEQIIQVSVATSEGEDINSFRTRCKSVPGFPSGLLDVMAPSPNAFFSPLMDALNGAHRGTGQRADFCELIGNEDAINHLAQSIASLTGP